MGSYIKDTIISSPSIYNCLIHCEKVPEASMINLSLLCCFSNTNEINNMEKRCWISVGGPVILFLKHAGEYVWFQTCIEVLLLNDCAGQRFISFWLGWFSQSRFYILYNLRSFHLLHKLFPLQLFHSFNHFLVLFQLCSWLSRALNILLATPRKRRWDTAIENFRQVV